MTGRLTPRQTQIVQAWANGQDAATLLHMAPSTVRTHAQSIFVRLGVHTRAGAVGVAMRTGLIPVLYPETI